MGGGGGGAISIPVSMLWTYPCPLLFYQIKKILIVFFQTVGTLIIIYLDDYALNCKDSRECSDELRYSCLHIVRIRICDTSKNVSDDQLTGDVVSGYGNKLQRNYRLSSRQETPKK